MRPGVRALPIVLALALACGSADGSPAGRGDYLTELELVSQNAHIQERGLVRQLRTRLERAGSPDEQLTVIVINVDQRARLYEDVVGALTNLEPMDGLDAAHDAYVEAWRGQLDLIRKVRDPGFRTVPAYLSALRARAFKSARATVRATCEELQTIAVAADRQVDLACRRRPA